MKSVPAGVLCLDHFVAGNQTDRVHLPHHEETKGRRRHISVSGRQEFIAAEEVIFARSSFVLLIHNEETRQQAEKLRSGHRKYPTAKSRFGWRESV